MANKKISDLLTSNEFDDTEITGAMGFEVYDPAGSTDTLKSGASVFSKFMKAMWRLYPERVSFVIDGNGATITTGVRGDWIVPYDCTITGYTAVADQSGSIVLDLWQDTYANHPPTVADTITASAKPTITTATKTTSTTLTGWTTSLTAGSVLRFNVDSVTSIQRLTFTLHLRRTA